MDYDFSGWATKNNIKCSDGRTIMKDAFIDNDGAIVPLVWNHQHNDPSEVLGHALLENREEGVYTYCKFNDTESGKTAKALVANGDVNQLSIYANRLKSQMNNVIHGCIREVSLVLAGANPGAYIDSVVMHGEDADGEEEGMIYTDEPISVVMQHSDEKSEEKTVEEIFNTLTEEQKQVVYLLIGEALNSAEKDSTNNKNKGDDTVRHSDEENEMTVEEVFDTLTDEQKEAVYAIVGEALDEVDDDEEEYEEYEEYEEGDEDMKHNVFDNDFQEKDYLTHSDEEAILSLAKSNNVGSFQNALEIFADENSLSHDAIAGGFVQTGDGNVTQLFPEYQEVRPGAPELITNDQGWISVVLNKVHKSPISRIRTSQVDIRNIDTLRAKGYGKGKEKGLVGNFKLVRRTTDPQTVYVKNALHRDDIIDITDFDYVKYLYNIDKMNLNEELAIAIMLGDGREEGDADKIDPTHIRPIWTDDELYTLHVDLDVEAARAELQGSDTGKHFGDNFVRAEAMINTVLYAREKYKGTGTPDFYCTPRTLNEMMLARDLNGRRIYSSKAELASALNVGNIYTAEQFAGKTRTDEKGTTKGLVGIICNLADYSLGATKGGQVTHFTQFDIDFNQEKSLLETRCSGALTRVYSAIAIEEPIQG